MFNILVFFKMLINKNNSPDFQVNLIIIIIYIFYIAESLNFK